MELARSLLSPVAAYTWPPLVSISRRTILSLLGQIKVGQLIVHDASTNITTVCGDGACAEKQTNGKIEPEVTAGRRKGPPRAVLRVQRDTFWVRMILFADMVRPIEVANAGLCDTQEDALSCRAVTTVSVPLIVQDADLIFVAGSLRRH